MEDIKDFEAANETDCFVFEVTVSDENANKLKDIVLQGRTYDRNFELGIKLLIQGTKKWAIENEDLNVIPKSNVSQWIEANFEINDNRDFRCLTPLETYERVRQIKGDKPDDVKIIELPNLTQELQTESHYIPSFNPIGLRIGKGIAHEDKGLRPALLLIGGIHGDEFATPLAVLNFVDFLLGSHTGELQDQISKVLRENEVIAFPLINPGGLQFSIDSRTSHRKNINPRYSDSTDGSFGVDLNRNFPIYFGHSGSNVNPDTYTFPGPYPFSEIETINIDDFVQANKNIVVAVDTHSGHDKFVYHPGHVTIRAFDGRRTYKRPISELYDLMYKLMDSEMESALGEMDHGYSIGISDDFAGTSDEYFCHGAGILGFSIEIDGTKTPQVDVSYKESNLKYFNHLVLSMLSSINKYSIDKYLRRAKI